MPQKVRLTPEVTELYVIRHGETLWNIQERVQGYQDSPLTEKGVAQAHAVGKVLREFGLDGLFASDLGRARHTAELIGTHIGLEPTFDNGLRERNLGVFEGLTKTEMQTRFPREFADFSTWNPDYRIPQGESARDLHDRLKPTLNRLIAAHPGKRLGIITHGGALDIVMRLTMNVPLGVPRHYSLFNAALNIVAVRSGTWNLTAWGETAHLRGIGLSELFL